MYIVALIPDVISADASYVGVPAPVLFNEVQPCLDYINEHGLNQCQVYCDPIPTWSAPHSMVIWTMKQYEIPEKGENYESC